MLNIFEVEKKMNVFSWKTKMLLSAKEGTLGKQMLLYKNLHKIRM